MVLSPDEKVACYEKPYPIYDQNGKKQYPKNLWGVYSPNKGIPHPGTSPPDNLNLKVVYCKDQ